MKYLINLKVLSLLCILFTTQVIGDDESRINYQKLNSPENEKPVWAYKESPIKECENAISNTKEIQDERGILESNGIRVLATERNLTQRPKGSVKNCGDSGNYVVCAMILPQDIEAAKKLGFNTGGLCQRRVSKRVH
jgi:hypothetical protein